MSDFYYSCMDAFNFLNQLDTESVDLVVTDIPYESLEKWRAIGTTTRLKHSDSSSNDWFKVFPNARIPGLLSELYRVLRDNRHFYFFCDQETMFIAKPMAEAAGFKFWKPLVWDKQTMGMGYHYRCQYEFILFFEKGKRKLNDLSVTDILRAKSIRGEYPAQKPISIAETLILQSTKEGERVIDPFMGSGTFGVAALKHGREFVGNDIDMKAVDLAKARLSLVGRNASLVRNDVS